MKKFLTILISILLLVVMAVPTFAATADELGLPSPNLVFADSSGYTSAVITYTEADNQYYLHLFKSVPSAVLSDATPDHWNISATGGYKQYRLNNGLWDFQNESDSNFSFKIDNPIFGSPYGRSYVWSTEALGGYAELTPDANFFPKPLYLQVQEVTTETMEGETVPAVVGTMKVLTLCGVGLIALLVVLKLFGKRSLISLR